MMPTMFSCGIFVELEMCRVHHPKRESRVYGPGTVSLMSGAMALSDKPIRVPVLMKQQMVEANAFFRWRPRIRNALRPNYPCMLDYLEFSRVTVGTLNYACPSNEHAANDSCQEQHNPPKSLWEPSHKVTPPRNHALPCTARCAGAPAASGCRLPAMRRRSGRGRG